MISASGEKPSKRENEIAGCLYNQVLGERASPLGDGRGQSPAVLPQTVASEKKRPFNQVSFSRSEGGTVG